MVSNINNEKDKVLIEPFEPNSKLEIYLKDCYLGENLIEYLNKLNTKSGICENYIDKDYLIDYQNFYCRSFDNHERYTKRIHFFSLNFNLEEFEEKYLNKYDEKSIKELQDSYLGFIIIKPIKNQENKFLIGRTLLKIHSEINKPSKYVKHEYSVSLFGIPLVIKTLPFQTQDRRVSACATIALWIALNPLSYSLDIVHYSPSQITEMSASYPGLLRTFPSKGLTWDQMIKCIKSTGLDTEIINVGKYASDEIFTVAVKAYLENKIPLIGGLTLRKVNEPDLYHAIVISGYRCDNTGKIVELLIHDDQIGPYTSTLPIGSFKTWENDWKTKSNMEVIIDKLMIPIYHKIRLTFPKIYAVYDKTKRLFPNYRISLHLTTIQDYKKYLLKKKIKNKKNVLMKFLPRFLWIIRIFLTDEIKFDIAYDATSIIPTIKSEILHSD